MFKAIFTRIGAIVLIVLALLGAGAAMSQSNIPGPTLGGKQVWSDVHALGTWRLQRNVLTGHHRLLDGDNWRQAWGTYDECLAALRDAQKTEDIAFQGPNLVILVHGLGRSAGMFGDLQQTLKAAGFETFAINYPSTRQGVAAHADDLARLIENLEGVQEVSFVTHSMGALVVRELFDHTSMQETNIVFRRLVMIAPPNQGSAIARLLRDNKVYGWLTTETGRDLTPGKAKAFAVPNIDFAIIAGGRGDGVGFNPILEGDDDGVVSVRETRLQDSKDFLVIASPHGLIDNHPLTQSQVLSFLKSGRFIHAPQ